MQAIKHNINRIRITLFALIFSVLQVIGQKITQGGPLSHLDETNIDLSFSLGDIFCIIAIAAVVSLLTYIVGFIFHKLVKINKERKKATAISYIFMMLVIIVCWLPYLLTFIPGGVWSDTVSSIMQCLGNDYNNHHPLLYTFSWKIVIHIFGTRLHFDWIWIVEAYVVIQAIMLSFACSYMIVWMYNNGVSIVICTCGAIYACLFFQFPLYVLSLWKDTPFACIFMIYVCIIGDVIIDHECFSDKRWCTKFALLTLLLMFSRNNGFFIVVLTSAALFFYLLNKRGMKTFSIITVLALISYFVITGPIYNYFEVNSTDKKEETYGIMLQQIAYIVSAEDSDISKEEYAVIENILPLEVWKTEYAPYNVDRIKWVEGFNHEYFNDNIGEILRCYFSLCRKNFKKAAEAYLMTTNGFWDVTKQNTHGYIILDNWGLDLLGDVKYNFLNEWFGINLSGKLWTFKLISSAVFIWIYVFIGVLITGIKRSNVIPLIPGYTLWLTMLIATPVAFHHRYIIGIVFTIPMAFAMLSFSKE